MSGCVAVLATWFALLAASGEGDDRFPRTPPPVEIGSTLDGATLEARDVAGAKHDLAPGGERGAVVLAWTGVDCPMARVYAPRLATIAAGLAGRPVRFFLVGSNAHDSPEELRSFVKTHRMPFPVLDDRDGSLARRLGARRTTHVVVLDARRRIRYRGAVDDQYGYRESGGVGTYRKDAPRRHHLREAITAVLEGRKVEVASTKALGCALAPSVPFPPNPSSPVRGDESDAERPTFHERIEPLIQEHCQPCHRAGGAAPFALTGFDEIRGWAPTIREVVSARRMPPWNADPRHGRFRNDRSLDARTVRLFERWVDVGAPRGDPASAPPPRSWPDGSELGPPDLVLEVPQFRVPATGRVPYRYVTLATSFPEDRWVRAARFRSTAPEVVHHVLAFASDPRPGPGAAERPWTPTFNVFQLLQGADPKDWPRWIERNRAHLWQLRVGNAGGLNGYFLAMLPGDEATVYPPGRAKLLPAGASILLQLHYTPNGVETESRTTLSLWLADGPPAEAVDVRGASTVVFEIPPGASDHRVEARFELPRAARLLSLRPHMHLRGKSFTYLVEYPDGSGDTLLHVPRYDFDWQHEYSLEEPLSLPRGTVLRAVGTFDNSAANPYNPDPTKTVYFGLQSEEEMLIGYFEVIWDQRPSAVSAGSRGQRPDAPESDR